MRTVVVIDLAWGERAATGVVVARGDAGAYPANRSIPWLAGPRGGRLAARFGLSLDRVRDCLSAVA